MSMIIITFMMITTTTIIIIINIIISHYHLPVDELLPEMKTGKPCHMSLKGKRIRDLDIDVLCELLSVVKST